MSGGLYRRLARPVLFRIGRGDAEAAHERTVRALELTGRVPGGVRALAVACRSGGVLRSARVSESARVESGRVSGSGRIGSGRVGSGRIGSGRVSDWASGSVSGSVSGSGRVLGAREVFGVRFPGPVGLAAGADKDGRALRAWPALGFGFIEVGTVTARAQPGNERPRLLRLPESRAVINRMGFNNAGAAALAERLRRAGPLRVPLGVSLGKSKVTPLEDAVDDYLASLRALESYGDYFAVNVSSPNTPGLRALQDKPQLAALLAALRRETAKPILVKLAPDLDEMAIADAVEVCVAGGAAGIIAVNTTLARHGLAPGEASRAAEPGGLSGAPLAARAREVVAFIAKLTGGDLPIIGVGGISGPDDARAMLDAGASLIQLYTGLIYEGPALVRAINRSLPAAGAVTA